MPVLGTSPVVGPTMHSNTGVPSVDANTTAVVDGTPVRVIMLAFAGAAGLMALKFAGFKFNVGVSN